MISDFQDEFPIIQYADDTLLFLLAGMTKYYSTWSACSDPSQIRRDCMLISISLAWFQSTWTMTRLYTLPTLLVALLETQLLPIEKYNADGQLGKPWMANRHLNALPSVKLWMPDHGCPMRGSWWYTLRNCNGIITVGHYCASCSVAWWATCLFTYLRLPLGTIRPTITEFAPLINKIERRLSGINKFLSYNGRLILVNSVFSALPNFYMCT